MTATRTDVHRPSALDPADYEEVGYVDMHPKKGSHWIDPDYRGKEYFGSRPNCDHCGQHIRYGVIFHHGPSDQLVTVGERCAMTLALTSKTEREFKRQREEMQRRAAVATWKAANVEAADWLERVVHSNDVRREFPGVQGSTWGFLHDLLHKLNRYGNLSERQTDAILKVKARVEQTQARRAAEAEQMADVAPLVEGRYLIEGEIVSTKEQQNDYGFQWKMLVKLDDGNKVWGTIPNSLFCLDVEHAAGERVRFTAQFTRSRDDEHFGFFKRPTGAAVVGS